ncbi:MAG TPA: DUF4157 domain-containing protein, partial [Candidatus Binatia bacterium]|nr:DUF4157 domain-containing protein [Candidatus Binatia bacterium]
MRRQAASIERAPESRSADAAAAPARGPSRTESVLGLQQAVGNRAVADLVAGGREPESGREERVGDRTAGLIVDDDAVAAAGGAMRKSDFFVLLRRGVRATADEGLAATGRTAEDCPWIEHWIGYYADKSAAHVERAIRKFAPETAGATSAIALIPPLVARVRRSVDRWARTGEVEEMPEGASDELPGGGLLGVLFKRRGSGSRSVADARVVRAGLGRGQALEGAVRSRMESGFGMSFGRVRVHTDARASTLADRFDARALTVGRDVAFAGGEYRPGTPVGDALIAHELAHVVQQDGGSRRTGGALTAGLEQDADSAAADAVGSLWSVRRRGAGPG